MVDLLRGTKLQQMAGHLGFWAYRLENAFPANMHNKLATLTKESFDPDLGAYETMPKPPPRSNKQLTTRC